VLPYNKGSRILPGASPEPDGGLNLSLAEAQEETGQKIAVFTAKRIICNYIVDFYCPDAKLVIEINGGQHYAEPGMVKDAERTVTWRTWDSRS